MQRILLADDYDKIAREIVDHFVKESTPLTAGVTKKAEELELNPDQIKNLVHAANTIAHLALMDQKTDGDKYVEFDPVDPDAVMKNVYVKVVSNSSGSNTGAGTSMCGGMPSLADFFGDLPGKVVPSEQTPATPAEDEATKPRNSILIMKIQKVASELENGKNNAAVEYQDQLDKLASDFAKLYGPSLEDFEKDAYDIYGDRAMSLLADLRHCLRMPAPTNRVFEKTARLVDSKTPQMKVFANMIKLAETHSECSLGTAYLKKHLGDVL
jgi:hypothetical protein